MFANIVYATVDMSRLDEAVGGIEGVKQRLSALAGFKGAYWFGPIEGRGISINLWEDEASARAAAFPVGASPAPGVTIERVETRAVIGRA